jgi:hypothetical protein
MRFLKSFLTVALLLSFSGWLCAQEYIAPLQENVVLRRAAQSGSPVPVQKATVLGLPFFEDFTGAGFFPDPERWADRLVYVNNSFGWNPVSRGVATFDALDEFGLPYDTVAPYNQSLADTLTSLPIDLSSYTVADSVYLSFFFQPRGYGFSPKAADSFMLYFLKSSGVWEPVWSTPGDTLQPFRQVMVPLTDTGYFNAQFRMRWINKATMGISNSHWHLDYIRLDAGRTIADTLVRDLAFSRQPRSVLADFTAMPFAHFKTNPAAFLASEQKAYLRNSGNTPFNLNVQYKAKIVEPATDLGSGSGALAIGAWSADSVAMPMFDLASFNPPSSGTYVVEHTYYCPVMYPGSPRDNDTIVQQLVFDNYFAYDDGSAEQSYFLNLQPNAPGTTIVEHALYLPDTLRGIAIKFARQVPSGAQKEFSIVVYKDIAYNGGSDQLIYQEEFLYPHYEDTATELSVYEFSSPVLMEPGIFYVGIMQPAGGISDSLYIALDANREEINHRYFRVHTQWQASQLPGALMLRPLVGRNIPLDLSEHSKASDAVWGLYPNPAKDRVQLLSADAGIAYKSVKYQICDVQGKCLQQGVLGADGSVEIAPLQAGIYFVRILKSGQPPVTLKMLKY